MFSLLRQMPPGGGDQSFWTFGPWFLVWFTAYLAWSLVRWLRKRRRESEGGHREPGAVGPRRRQ